MKKIALTLFIGITTTFNAMAIEHVDKDATCDWFKLQDAPATVTSNESDPTKTKEKFELISNRITSLYSDTIKQLGGNLQVDLDWDLPEANAYARKINSLWLLEFYGALYRHKTVTDDGYALTVCHELGHLIGGAPFKVLTKLSVEGQADFWATSVCLKKYFTEYPEKVSMKEGSAKQQCDRQYADDENAKNNCYRTALAGMSMATFFSELMKAPQPEFEKKDPKDRSATKQIHPEAQCRLDTYLSGSLCNLEDTSLVFEEKLLKDKLTTDFLCSQVIDGQLTKIEQRPKCWFNELNNALYTNYKNKVRSKSLVGLKGGKINLTYFNNLPGEYRVKVVPDPATSFYVQMTSDDYMASLPASGQTYDIAFTYRFVKRANRKLKFYIIVEYNGKVILDRDNVVTIDATALVPY